MGASALGIAGLGLGFLQNQQNRSDANNANQQALAQAQLNYLLQKGGLDRQYGLFDQVKGIVDQANAHGQFDPGTQLSLLRDDTARNQSLDLGNYAAAMRQMGFHPGDAGLTAGASDIANKYQLDYRNQDEAIRQGLFGQKLAAYNSIPQNFSSGGNVNAASGSLVGLNENLANMYRSQLQNPAGLIAGILPYLQSKQPTTIVNNIPGNNITPGSLGNIQGGNFLGGWMRQQQQYGSGNPTLFNQWNQQNRTSDASAGGW